MNIWEHCDEQPHKFSFNVADTGKCSKCGKVAECWDHELIGLYKSLDISDDVIWEKLPRLLTTRAVIRFP